MAAEAGENKYEKYGQPTLDLVFTGEKKSLTDRAGNVAVGFARTTTATYVGSDGLIKTAAVDEARFDHDPVTGESLGLLIEESRTNLELNSATLGNLARYELNESPNNGISPDGTLTSSKFVITTTNDAHYLSLPFNSFGGNPFDPVLSVFIKPIEQRKLAFIHSRGNGGQLRASIDFDTGTIELGSSGNAPGNPVVSYKSLANGWYRVSFATDVTAWDSHTFYICAYDTLPLGFVGYSATALSISSFAFAGDGVASFYAWGIQREESSLYENGSFPTSYIPTPATFTSRASEATYYDQNGIVSIAATDVARDDAYLPDENGNFISAELLLEDTATNFITNSEEMNLSFTQQGQSVWTTSAPSVTAPDGSSTGIALTCNNGAVSRSNASFTYTFSADQYTFSVWIKEKDPLVGNKIHLRYGDVSDPHVVASTYTLSGIGSVGGDYEDADFASIQKFPNDWYRCSMTFTAIAGSETIGIWFVPPLDAAQTGASIYAWGAQLEEGSYPTSYIPTSGSTATRAADISSSSTSTRGADTASISNAFSTTAFTIVNEPFGSASGSDTFQILGAGSSPVKRTTVYGRNLNQSEINALAEVTDDFWRWRVLGSSFALPSFTVGGGGQVTVDWGDGTVETLTTSEHTFSNGGGYHDIGFRLDSGTYFRPNVSNDATHKTKVVAVGPAPASMIIYGQNAFYGCSNLNAVDPTAVLTGNGSLGWYKCSSLTTFPLIDTSSVTSLYFTWRDCTSLTSFPAIDTSNVTDFTHAWNSCTSLTSFPLIDVSSGGSNFSYTWQNCSSLTSFPLLDFSACTGFTYTWTNCSSLTSFPLINTSSVTSFGAAWYQCSGLTSFPLLDTSSGTNFTSAWYNCSSLTSFPLIDTSSATSFSNTWRGCSSLTSFPAIDSSNVTNFSSAWYGCYSLTSFPTLNTSNVTNFYTAWFACGSLTSFPLINTSSGTSFQQTWESCSGLTSFPSLDFSSATTFYYAWLYCTNLANVPAGLFDTVTNTTDFTNAFGGCALTAQSIENILVSIDTANQSTGTLALGISGGTNAGYSTWSSAAQTALSNLQTKGWTVSYNP